MRLHYLRIQNVKPLEDVRLSFQQETVLDRRYALHYIVGLNGSGKTRLLQSMAELFLELEKPRLPSFPCTIAYELGRTGTGQGGEHRLCYLRHPHQGASRSETVFLILDIARLRNLDLKNIDWDHLPESLDINPMLRDATMRHGTFDELGSGGDLDLLLPAAILAYTSGDTMAWERMFFPQETPIEVLGQGIEFEHERPWSEPAESNLGVLLAGDEDLSTRSRGLFLTNIHLKLATAALVLQRAHLQLTHDDGSAPVLDAPFAQVKWMRTITLGLRIQLQKNLLNNLPKPEVEQLRGLYQVATFVRRDVSPSESRLYAYDLEQTIDKQYDLLGQPSHTATASALWLLLGGESASLLQAFRTLYRWHRIGLLDDVTMLLKKEHVDEVISYDHLSDGERMYLGRMAALLLAHDTDNVFLILDEPETHFNDNWKREIVDVIDGAMQDRVNEVVISTHSSIALTDAFDTEIILLEKAGDQSSVVRTPVHTFGATPSQIMRYIFGTGHSAGERATQYLDLILMLSEHRNEVESYWQSPSDSVAEADGPLDRLTTALEKVPHDYGNQERRRQILVRTLSALRKYAEERLNRQTVSLVEALDALQDRLGQGYFEFELLRRINHLEAQDENAAPVA